MWSNRSRFKGKVGVFLGLIRPLFVVGMVGVVCVVGVEIVGENGLWVG